MSLRSTLVFASLAWTLAGYACHASDSSSRPAEPAQQLIRDVVYNELAEHRHHGYFAYLDTKQTGRRTLVKAEVETKQGRVSRLLSTDGQPLTAEEQKEENARLNDLLKDRSAQQKLLRDYQQDEERIAKVISLLPEGFLFDYDDIEGETIRLRYRPNPAFNPPTYEAKVFSGMAGHVWIDIREKRLVRLEGRLVSNVNYGYGILGRLDKGGSFDMQRVEVSPGNWKTSVLDVHITGYIILLKNISKEQRERRTNFTQVPPNLTLEQAEAVLSHRPSSQGVPQDQVASK